MIRDTCQFPKFRDCWWKSPSLKKLIKHFIQVDIQIGQHSSVEDARATMLLFRLFKRKLNNLCVIKTNDIDCNIRIFIEQ